MLKFPAIFRCSTLDKLAPAQIKGLLSLSLFTPFGFLFCFIFVFITYICTVYLLFVLYVRPVCGYVHANSEETDPCEAGIMGGCEAT